MEKVIYRRISECIVCTGISISLLIPLVSLTLLKVLKINVINLLIELIN